MTKTKKKAQEESTLAQTHAIKLNPLEFANLKLALDIAINAICNVAAQKLDDEHRQYVDETLTSLRVLRARVWP